MHGYVSFKIMSLCQPNPENKNVDVVKIKTLLNNGLSEAPYEDRCFAWLVILGVFPKNPNDWKTTREQIVKLYDILIKEYHVEDWIEKVIGKFTRIENIENKDIEDKATFSLIHTDIVRTGRHICFMPPDENPIEPKEHDSLLPFSKTMRRLERILYVFARSNPNYGYMQGFNELVSLLYFVVKKAGHLFNDDEFEIEALTFMAFTNLITNTSVQEFCDAKDKSSQMQNLLKSYDKLLHKHDKKTAELLDSLNIDPFIYAYRWYNMIFAQEYDLPSLLILWDACFAHIDYFSQYILYVGVAHIKALKSKFVEKDFSVVLGAIQGMENLNIVEILKDTNKMWNKDRKIRKMSL